MTDLLNKLIICNESIGAIRYIGPIHKIPHDSELWYGIEWKDSNRGKHDGSFDGKRYFKTKHPTSGSFVRPNKVEFGIEIWKSIQDKYLFIEEEELNEKKEKEIFHNFNETKTITCINLAYSRVSEISSLAKINEKFPCLKELDLEGNLLDSWSKVFTILDELKTLQIINVSNNFMETPENNSKLKTYSNIRHLILNKMNYNWDDIEKVLAYFPCLIQLKICFNLVDKITLNESLLKELQIIDLELNPIHNWKHVDELGKLEKLEVLYANEIGLTEIRLNEKSNRNFAQLKIISLNNNRINDWLSINELNKLPNLEDVRFKFNPLNHLDSLENIRQMFIAKIEKLNYLNRTKIDIIERKGSEIDYIKNFGSEWLKITDNSLTISEIEAHKAKFFEQHPRYEKLIKKYGAAEKCELAIQPQNLKSNLISLNFKNEENGELIIKKIPITIDIQRLKHIISKLFKYDLFNFESIKLFYTSSKTPNDEFELDNNLRQLSFYAIENGDTIISRRE